jgi:hypothetical protein
MVEFKLQEKENLKYLQIIFSGKVVGIISKEGILWFQDVSTVGYINSADSAIINRKCFEVERYGIIICRNCGGTPMFPGFVKKAPGTSVLCSWGIHNSSGLTI